MAFNDAATWQLQEGIPARVVTAALRSSGSEDFVPLGMGFQWSSPGDSRIKAKELAFESYETIIHHDIFAPHEQRKRIG